MGLRTGLEDVAGVNADMDAGFARLKTAGPAGSGEPTLSNLASPRQQIGRHSSAAMPRKLRGGRE
jgi:hypothetical protein